MTTQSYTGTLTVVTCADCGMSFGVPKLLHDQRRQDHRTFYCPSGHSNYYPQQSDVERLRDQLESARTQTDFWRTEQRRTELRRRAAVGQATKIKRRVSKGVCPCCNRSFPNLADHMANEHPGFEGEQP